MAKFVTYENTDNYIDYATGEITSKVQTKTLRLDHKSPEKFFKLFVESMGNLYGLNTASSFKVLFAVLNMATNRENVVCLAFGMRSQICESIGIHLNVFKKALDELVDKEFLKKTDKKGYFILNPYIFGQGSFIDVERLRQSIEFEYDFKKGEIKRTISADSITSAGMSILKDSQQYEVVKAIKEESIEGSNIDVVVEHKGSFDEKDDIHPRQQLLPFDSIEDDKTQNTEAEKDNKTFDVMIQSFEITSKMLDRIKDLESSGRTDEAMSLQKSLERYLDKFGNI